MGMGKRARKRRILCAPVCYFICFSCKLGPFKFNVCDSIVWVNGGDFSTSVQVRELVLKFDSRNFYVMFKKRTGVFYRV